MKSAGITVVVVASLVAAIALYEIAKPLRMREPTATEVKTEIDKLRAEAAQKHPDMAQSDALREVATAQANQMLKGGDAGSRAKTAAGIFFGAYYMNTRARPEYCRRRGVDLAPFVAAFDRAHQRELASARAIFRREGIDPESMVPMLQDQFVPMIEQDMKDFAAGAQVPVDQACGLFNQNAKLLAESIALPAEARSALLGH